MLTPTGTIEATLGEAIDGAKSQLLAAIENRVEELACRAIARAATQIAESVLSAVSDPFDSAEIENQIG